MGCGRVHAKQVYVVQGALDGREQLQALKKELKEAPSKEKTVATKNEHECTTQLAGGGSWRRGRSILVDRNGQHAEKANKALELSNLHDNMVPQKPGEFACAACGKMIEDEMQISDGHAFHTACLLCENCGKPRGADFYEAYGLLVCNNCAGNAMRSMLELKPNFPRHRGHTRSLAVGENRLLALEDSGGSNANRQRSRSLSRGRKGSEPLHRRSSTDGQNRLLALEDKGSTTVSTRQRSQSVNHHRQGSESFHSRPSESLQTGDVVDEKIMALKQRLAKGMAGVHTGMKRVEAMDKILKSTKPEQRWSKQVKEMQRSLSATSVESKKES